MEKAVAEGEEYSENTPPKMFDASEKCSYDPVKYHCWSFFCENS